SSLCSAPTSTITLGSGGSGAERARSTTGPPGGVGEGGAGASPRGGGGGGGGGGRWARPGGRGGGGGGGGGGGEGGEVGGGGGGGVGGSGPRPIEGSVRVRATCIVPAGLWSLSLSLFSKGATSGLGSVGGPLTHSTEAPSGSVAARPS